MECEPIVFFLKCLDDDDANLEEFLKKEIKARNIFLYCKSKNSENSKWVKTELEFIRSFDKARCYELDIESDFNLNIIYFLYALSDIIRRNRVLVCCTPSEQDIGERILKYCRDLGYKAKSIYDMRKEIYCNADNYEKSEEEIKLEIDRYVNGGIFIWLISPTSAKKSTRHSRFPEYAYESYERGERKGIILPVVVKSTSFNKGTMLIPDSFRQFPPCTINVENVEEGLSELGKKLKEIGLSSIYTYKDTKEK